MHRSCFSLLLIVDDDGVVSSVVFDEEGVEHVVRGRGRHREGVLELASRFGRLKNRRVGQDEELTDLGSEGGVVGGLGALEPEREASSHSTEGLGTRCELRGS